MNSAPNWYTSLNDRLDTLMKKHDMPEDIALEINDFVVNVAKEQYKAGNRSGISWLRKKMHEESRGQTVAVAA